MAQKKLLHLEILRVISAFMVIFNHSAERGFLLFMQCPPRGIMFWIYLCLSVLCKFAVPVFFAISGALLLARRDEPVKKQLKRLARTIIALVLFSLFYYIVDIKISGGAFSIKEFFIKAYTKDTNYALWFLYAYIGFLLALPILRVLANNFTKKQFLYTFVLAIIFQTVIPVFQLLFLKNYKINSNISIGWVCNNTIVYPLLGYFLEHKVDIKRDHHPKRTIMELSVIIIGITITVSAITGYYILTHPEIRGNDEILQDFFRSFDVIMCGAVYMLVKYICNTIKIKTWFQKICLSIGECSFGIYLFHIFFLKKLPYAFVLNDKMIELGVPRIISIFVVCILVMFISYTITWVLKKVPGLKKLL